MQTSSTFRILVATAVVSALAILMTSPAQAYYVNEGSGASVTAPVVGNPGDSAQVPAAVVGNAGDGASVPAVQGTTVASSGSDGLGGTTIAIVTAGIVLVLGAGALLFQTRQRRVALP